MIKFLPHYDFKHKDCIDAFIRVQSVIMDTGETAIIRAFWMIQGTESHWFATEAVRIFIKQDQYEKWEHHVPNGDTL